MHKLREYFQQNQSDYFSADLKISGNFFKLGFFNTCESDELIFSNQSVAVEAEKLERKNELWKETCFECFFSVPGEPSYFEVNFSPQGFWNVYSFDSYRSPHPPRESNLFVAGRITAEKSSTSFEFECIKKDFQEIDVSLCAIVKQSEKTEYFSSAHRGTKPDFHLRESFDIRIKNNHER